MDSSNSTDGLQSGRADGAGCRREKVRPGMGEMGKREGEESA